MSRTSEGGRRGPGTRYEKSRLSHDERTIQFPVESLVTALYALGASVLSCHARFPFVSAVNLIISIPPTNTWRFIGTDTLFRDIVWRGL